MMIDASLLRNSICQVAPARVFSSLDDAETYARLNSRRHRPCFYVDLHIFCGGA